MKHSFRNLYAEKGFCLMEGYGPTDLPADFCRPDPSARKKCCLSETTWEHVILRTRFKRRLTHGACVKKKMK